VKTSNGFLNAMTTETKFVFVILLSAVGSQTLVRRALLNSKRSLPRQCRLLPPQHQGSDCIRFGLTTRAAHGMVVYAVTGLIGDLGSELAWMTEGVLGSFAALRLSFARDLFESTLFI
jgi:hypothetical protein